MTTGPSNLKAFGEALSCKDTAIPPYGDPRSVDSTRLGELAIPCAQKGQNRICIPGQPGCRFLQTMSEKMIVNSPPEIQATLVNACGGAMLNTVLDQELKAAEQQIHLVTTAFDRAQDELERESNVRVERAMLDPLTGLGGRGTLFNMYDKLIGLEAADSELPPDYASIVFFDLNELKDLNDRFGHDAGDELLVTFANYLRSKITINDLAIRFGGDEFILVMSNHTEERLKEFIDDFKAGLEDPENEIIKDFREKYGVNGISTAIGYVHLDIYETGPITRKMLNDYIQQADDAMYKNKQQHRRIARRRKDNLSLLSGGELSEKDLPQYVDHAGRFILRAA